MKPHRDRPETVTVHVPMAFAIRGGRKMIISEHVPALPQPRTDNAILKALAKAHRWRQQIEGGEYASITELATAHGINQSYACRLLRLTLLSPEIVTSVLDGRQPPTLTLNDLLRPQPVRWDQQAAAVCAHDQS